MSYPPFVCFHRFVISFLSSSPCLLVYRFIMLRLGRLIGALVRMGVGSIAAGLGGTVVSEMGRDHSICDVGMRSG